jgi:hypothetical protein
MTRQADAEPGVDFVDLREARDPELLDALHRDLFLPNFPDPDEQEGPEDWRPRLWGDPQPPQPEQHGFVAGTHLATDRSLAGFALVERYRESRCALLSYIAVAARRRGEGIARGLCDRADASVSAAAERDGQPLRGIFGEIHDPARVADASDVIRPWDRVRIMERLGGWRVPVTYVQPALDETSQRSDRLMLIAFPLDGQPFLDPDAILDFLSEFYRALGIADPEADPDFRRTTEELRTLGPGPVHLVPLTPS